METLASMRRHDLQIAATACLRSGTESCKGQNTRGILCVQRWSANMPSVIPSVVNFPGVRGSRWFKSRHEERRSHDYENSSAIAIYSRTLALMNTPSLVDDPINNTLNSRNTSCNCCATARVAAVNNCTTTRFPYPEPLACMHMVLPYGGTPDTFHATLTLAHVRRAQAAAVRLVLAGVVGLHV